MSRLFLAVIFVILVACTDENQDTPSVDQETSGNTPDPTSMGSSLAFTDAAEDFGLDFHFSHGGSGRKLFIEISAGGVGIFDYDGDGWPDIYCVNGAPTAGYEGPPLRNALFRNRGDGTFTEVAEKADIADTGYGCGLAVGDIDGDGDLDLYIANVGEDALYVNQGDGTFSRATDRGIAGDLWSSSATFFDYDLDGDLDLYVCHYCDYDLKDPPRCLSPSGRLDYCNPGDYNGIPDKLYRNDGQGHFEDVTAAAKVGDPLGRGFGVVAGDFDDDGDPDIYVANDQGRNNLYRNDGDGTFTDIGLYCGVGYGVDGKAEAGMGVDFGDFDGDGRLDLVVTNFANETNSLYRNLGEGLFADETLARGLGEPTARPLAFGGGFLDGDSDGDLDLYFACGHVLDTVDMDGQGQTFAQRDILLENRGGRFLDVSASAGTAFAPKRVGRAAAFGDLDLDGDIDIAVSHFDGPLAIYRNDTTGPGHTLSL
ncbi:MAG: VCBS repeat-containing protein, partial [Planctomycetota bacterium]